MAFGSDRQTTFARTTDRAVIDKGLRSYMLRVYNYMASALALTGIVAFATANRVAMLEHSVYSVISPEGCASILWKDSTKMREAAEALRVTAQDLEQLGVADRVISEPMGGAHRDRQATMQSVATAIEAMLGELKDMSKEDLVANRRKKFLNIGSKGLAA